MVPGTHEYNMVRNHIYAELRVEKARENKNVKLEDHVAQMVVPEFSSFYALMIVIPESTECFESMHVLKYFNFPINVEEDNILRQQVKKEMGF